MRTIVRGRNVEVPEQVRAYAERRLERIGRHVDAPADAVVELASEAHRSADDVHIVDVTLVVDGATLNGRATGSSFQAAIDEVVDKVERQVRDRRERELDRHRAGEERARRAEPAVGAVEREGRRIVRTKRFAIEPMFEEDAVAAMEELGHDFFVFVNAQGERLAVLYRRRDGDYGLIEPVVGGPYAVPRGS